ncbi:helix-turn-helix domain-containing protein [Oerskovia flava]|uniref:helix-turn-helix domain-containing protein n=1 Tax=Oerskovia flava TaxID=2986422 RepID=UPI002240012E|nr:helix-turn-helix domain-containing protein [Oerskovia sp. JB1-3-2]
MSMVVEHTVLPPAAGSTLPDLSAALEEAGSSSLVGPDGSQIALPDEVFLVLRDAVRAMARGQAITLAPHDTVLTTQGAADFLGISRPTLVRLLSDGEIPFTQPHRHRRVRLSDLVEYHARSRRERREILAQLSREATTDDVGGDGFEVTR